MVTQSKIFQLNIRVSEDDRQLYKSKAAACELSVSEYTRLLLESDQADRVVRDQRIAQCTQQLATCITTLQLSASQPDSNLFEDAIALIEQIQQEVSAA